MAVETLSLRRLNRATLARQLLLEREQVGVVDAVERLGGLQAQEPKPPFAALWSRLDGFDPADLHAALQARAIVRGTLMRGTLHLVTADDFDAFRAVLQPVLAEGMRALRDRAEGLELAQVLPAARDLLELEPRTFAELRTLLLERFPDVNERALGFAVRMHLPLVMVPTADAWAFPSTARFTLADRWLDRSLEGERPAEPLVLRHLAAFGPATAADVQSWSGLKRLGPVLEGLGDRLVRFEDERGRTLFDLPDAPRPDEQIVAPVRLLPEFDSLLLAHADRLRLVSDEHRGKLVTKNLRVRAAFLVDGFVQGTWTVSRDRKAATLELAPFTKLTKQVQKPLVSEAERMLRFLEPDAATYDVTVA